MTERKHTPRGPHLDKQFTKEEHDVLTDLIIRFEEFIHIVYKRFGRGAYIQRITSRIQAILNDFLELDKEHKKENNDA